MTMTLWIVVGIMLWFGALLYLVSLLVAAGRADEHERKRRAAW